MTKKVSMFVTRICSDCGKEFSCWILYNSPYMCNDCEERLLGKKRSLILKIDI